MSSRIRSAWQINGLLNEFLQSGPVYRDIPRSILDALGPLSGLSLDELGCGTGQFLRHVPDDVVARGIDLSSTSLSRARRLVGARSNITFHSVDFYHDLDSLTQVYSPDRVVAAKSLYHPDLSRSMGLLSGHLSDDGIAIVVHPKPDFREHVMVQWNGSRKFSPRVFVKSFGRLFHPFIGHYNLFEAEDFERVGSAHFSDVDISDAGLGAYFRIKLSK